MADEHFSESLWYTTQQLVSVVDDSFYKLVSDPLGLTVVEWHIVRALYRQDGQRPTDLSRAVGRAVTAFTPILDRLEREGWITRQAIPHDRRSVGTYLTDHAHQNRAQFEQSVTTLETHLQASLEKSDLQHLMRLREQLVKP